MVIANLYFSDENLSIQFSDGIITELFEVKLGVTKEMKNDIFVTKTVPILVLCDASITTTRTDNVLSYEISVDNKESFVRKIELIIKQKKELSV